MNFFDFSPKFKTEFNQKYRSIESLLHERLHCAFSQKVMIIGNAQLLNN